MIRLVHNQTVYAPILIDDIDDGLPNKAIHRLGSLGDPTQIERDERDGYANKPKQPCYIPFSHTAPNGSVVPGFITVQQTNRVILSQGKGKIAKLSAMPPITGPGSANFPLITVVTGITAAQLVAPVITAGVHGDPTVITGSTFLSVAPDITYVTFAQGMGVSPPVPSTLSAAQIIAAGGSVSATVISIPAVAFITPPVVDNVVFVTSNEKNSNVFTLT